MKDTVMETTVLAGAYAGERPSRLILQGIRAASTDEPTYLPQSNSTFPAWEDEVEVFEQKLYALCKVNRKREAIAEALDYFDDRLITRQFRACDRALRQLRVAELAPSVMVSILGITNHARTLKGRATFFVQAFQEIAQQKGTRYATELLDKYR